MSNDTIRSAPDQLVALREALNEAIRLATGPGNGTTTRSRPVEEWQRLYHLFRAALDSIEEGSRGPFSDDEIRALLQDHSPLSCDAAYEPCGGDHILFDAAQARLAAASPSREGAGPLAVKIADRLAAKYRAVPAAIAEACDETLDRSGNLLGWLRDYARLTSEEQREDGPAGGGA